MKYEKLFYRYGSPSNEADIRITGYLTKPDKLDTAERIMWQDKNAADIIGCCESMIEALKEYRQALAARYAQLETMTYKERLELERHPRICGGGISYYVRIVRTYEDGTEVKQLHETYSGKERRKALDRFEELKKQRPGIEAIKDIERKSWKK